MKMVSFLKDQWNLVVSLSVGIVAMLNSFVIPPHITLYAAEGSIDYPAFSRFIVVAVILLMLFPFSRFKSRKHSVVWWCASIVSLALAIMFYLNYIDFTNEKTGYNGYALEREVIGDKLNLLAQQAIDSVKKAEKIDSITPDKIVEELGEPKDIYPVFELAGNSKTLMVKYIISILFFSLFIVFSIQTLYCFSSTN